MEEIVVPVVSVLSTFGSIFGIAYIYFMTRHKERLALIEKELTGEIFKTTQKQYLKYWSLKIGLLFIGVGIGTIVGFVFWTYNLDHSLGVMATFASIMFFGGLGLLVSFFIERKLM
jgi:hypothetical protein